MAESSFYRKQGHVQWAFLILCLAVFLQVKVPVSRSQIPTFRASSNTVLLDIVVTDRKNRVVSDLAKEDFLVYEDGVLQQIQSFQAANRSTRNGGSGATAKELTAARPDVQHDASHVAQPNFIIFLVDYSTTEFENQNLVQNAAIRYVENRLGPNDHVAVFYLGAGFRFLQDFTQDRVRLAAVLKGRDVTGTALAGIGPQMGYLQASVLATAGQPVTYQSGGSGQETGQNAQAAGAQAAANSVYVINARIQAALASMHSAIRSRTARGVLAAIESISRAVAPIPERKTLVLFSQGFVIGPHMEPELLRAVDTANRANVAIYTIDSTGLSTGELSSDLIPQDRLSSISARMGRSRIPATGGESLFDRARTVGNDSHESALRFVAAETGGLSFRNTNDLSVSLDRVADDISCHYLLSYQPSNQAFDGGFRRLRVELKRAGLEVRTRSGYYALPPDVEGVTGEEYRLMTETRKGVVQSLPFDVALASFPGSSGLSRIPITIELPAREASFRDSGGSKVASIQMIGLLRGEDGHIVTRVGAPVNVAATPAELDILKAGSLSFTNTIDVVPGRYSFEAFVRDQNSGRAAIRDYSLSVPGLGKDLAVSSIVLASEVREAGDFEIDDYLAVGKARVLPSARRRFRPGDNLVFLLSVFNAKLLPENRANVEVRISLERPGSTRALALEAYRAENVLADPIPHIQVSRYVPLKDVGPGHYFLVAEVRDLESKQTCQARTSFEVVP